MGSKKVKQAKPQDINGPFGKISTHGNSTVYRAKYLPGQADTLDNTFTHVSDLAQHGIPQAQQQYTDFNKNFLGQLGGLTPDNIVNPQVYQATYQNEMNPINMLHQHDVTDLENNLAGQNLTGGSYDALAHHYLNQDYGTRVNTAANDATLAGLAGTGDLFSWLGAGSTAAGNQLANLGNEAQNYQSLFENTEKGMLDPLSQFTQYQSAVNPLTLYNTNLANAQPTLGQQITGAALTPIGAPGGLFGAGGLGGGQQGSSPNPYVVTGQSMSAMGGGMGGYSP